MRLNWFMAVLALLGEGSVLKISTDCGVTEEWIFVIIATVLRRQSVAQKILFMNRMLKALPQKGVSHVNNSWYYFFLCRYCSTVRLFLETVLGNYIGAFDFQKQDSGNDREEKLRRFPEFYF